jgi:phosphatidylglycerophosphate synthase
MFAILALTGSVMTSYTRARAEGLGLECDIGFMQRPERVIIVGTAATLCGIIAAYSGGDYQYYSETFGIMVFESISVLTAPLALVALFANVTAINRLTHCRKQIKNLDK